MIRLENLQPEDFNTFISWVPTQSDLFQFAGPMFSFPLSDEQLFNYINDGRRISYKIISTESNLMIGHCELNFEKPLPRLSRILIGNKNSRNKGLGKVIVNTMLRKLFIEKDYEQADLNVFDWNKPAIHCYEQVGFSLNAGVESEQKNNEEIWRAINMVIAKEVWMSMKENEPYTII